MLPGARPCSERGAYSSEQHGPNFSTRGFYPNRAVRQGPVTQGRGAERDKDATLAIVIRKSPGSEQGPLRTEGEGAAHITGEEHSSFLFLGKKMAGVQ